jgi:two-component system sensor histidine kinase KdpD
MSAGRRRQLGLLLAVAIPSLAGATLAIALLETYVGVPNASAVYLVAVVATAVVAGTTGAVASSVAAFLLYDFFFTVPTFTFTISEPGEWLSVTLLLFVGIVVGQLAALQRSRAVIARTREREARSLFQISRALATRESTTEVLGTIAAILRAEIATDRIWVSLGPDDATERLAADTGSGQRPTSTGFMRVLRRMPGEVPAEWVRVHQAAGRATKANRGEVYRVRVQAGGANLGSIWALRDRSLGEPDRTETRLLAAAADQIGQGLANDRLAAEAQAAEIARQSDSLKSALLQSVSHDLRTPLATIRAAAGTLRPGSGLDPADREESVDAIDREVEYLNRMVTNLLDLSRIEAGALKAERDVFDLDDLVRRTLDRLRPRLNGRPLDIDVQGPPVVVDPIFLDEAVTNIVDNALKYSPPGTGIRLRSRVVADPPVARLTIEDEGPGVALEHLPKLFDKFYRVPDAARSSRSGTGIGLAVVRGLVEAMGGTVRARRGDLGGLAVDIDLPLATLPAELTAAAPR